MQQNHPMWNIVRFTIYENRGENLCLAARHFSSNFPLIFTEFPQNLIFRRFGPTVTHGDPRDVFHSAIKGIFKRDRPSLKGCAYNPSADEKQIWIANTPGRRAQARRVASFYESHRAAASLSAELEIDFAESASKTGSQGWALCQGCHLAARTTLLSVTVPEYWPPRFSYLSGSLNWPLVLNFFYSGNVGNTRSLENQGQRVTEKRRVLCLSLASRFWKWIWYWVVFSLWRQS